MEKSVERSSLREKGEQGRVADLESRIVLAEWLF
jgi:hypothetical protein